MLKYIDKPQNSAAVDIGKELGMKLAATSLSKQFTAHTMGMFKEECAPRWFGEKINKVNRWSSVMEQWLEEGQICKHTWQMFNMFVLAFNKMSSCKCCGKINCPTCKLS